VFESPGIVEKSIKKEKKNAAVKSKNSHHISISIMVLTISLACVLSLLLRVRRYNLTILPLPICPQCMLFVRPSHSLQSHILVQVFGSAVSK
jgi:hypothetical protein